MKSYMLLALFIAGCAASFNVTYERDMFVATYAHTTVYNTYVVGVSISTFAAQQAFHNITLSHGEDWSSFCLDVVLSNPLPSYLEQFLPSNFLDLRVFYRVTPNGHACHQLARVCPDGTTIGQTGVNCEWQPCPGDSVCTDDVAFCADGVQVGRTGSKCEFNCPATDYSSIKAKNLTEILEIEDAFWDRYGDEYPYTSYLIAVDVKTLASMNKSHQIILTNDETWQSYCLSVSLVSFPADATILPPVYLGARVFYSLGKGVCPQSTRVTCGGPAQGSVSFVGIFVPITVLLVVGCAGFCCCVRRRKCACKSHFQRLPVEDPTPVPPVMMAPMMMPAEFDVEMMNGEQLPYETMMVPVGYPHMYGQQPVWFIPAPQQPEQQQQQ